MKNLFGLFLIFLMAASPAAAFACQCHPAPQAEMTDSTEHTLHMADMKSKPGHDMHPGESVCTCGDLIQAIAKNAKSKAPEPAQPDQAAVLFYRNMAFHTQQVIVTHDQVRTLKPDRPLYMTTARLRL